MGTTGIALALMVSAAGAGERAKLAVLDLTAAGEIDPHVAKAVGESVTAEVQVRGFFDPISSAEVATMLGAERQRQILGCAEDSCLTELAGALGARFVMSGSLAKLGGAFQLNLQVMDTRTSKILGRTTKLAKDFEGVRLQIPYAVAEACGTPLPPPPSRVVPYAMMSSGAAGLIAGGVLGILALNNESVLRGELSADDQNRAVVLQTAQNYRQRLDAVGAQKTVSVLALVAGAGLVGGGLYLNPPDAPQPGVKVAVVPMGNGVALVGVLP